MSSQGATRGRGANRARGGFRGRGSSRAHFAKGSSSQSVSTPGFEDDTEEDSEVTEMRKKYGDSVKMLQEIYPDWTQVDLLYTLREASGDIETAVTRISDGKWAPSRPVWTAGSLALPA